jgi:hypothetical protein
LSDASNMAHVHGASGTFVMPAHSAYDRQVLRELVERRAGRVSTLTLRGTRWTITPRTAADTHCATCTQFLGRLRCDREDDSGATCIDCAMNAGATSAWNGSEDPNE